MSRLAPMWLHRVSIIAILPFVIVGAIYFGAIFGAVLAVAEVAQSFRYSWRDKS